MEAPKQKENTLFRAHTLTHTHTFTHTDIHAQTHSNENECDRLSKSVRQRVNVCWSQLRIVYEFSIDVCLYECVCVCVQHMYEFGMHVSAYVYAYAIQKYYNSQTYILCGSCWSHIHTFETNATFLQTHRFLYIYEKKIFLGVVDLLCALFFRSIVSMLLCYCAVHLSRGIARFFDIFCCCCCYFYSCCFCCCCSLTWHTNVRWEREKTKHSEWRRYTTCIFNAFEKSLRCGAEKRQYHQSIWTNWTAFLMYTQFWHFSSPHRNLLLWKKENVEKSDEKINSQWR